MFMGYGTNRRRRSVKKAPLSYINQRALDAFQEPFHEYVRYLNRPWKLIGANFFSGLVRGFGMAVGFTLLGAIVIYFLQHIAYQNLPVIGDFIAEIVRIVQAQQYGIR